MAASHCAQCGTARAQGPSSVTELQHTGLVLRKAWSKTALYPCPLQHAPQRHNCTAAMRAARLGLHAGLQRTVCTQTVEQSEIQRHRSRCKSTCSRHGGTCHGCGLPHPRKTTRTFTRRLCPLPQAGGCLASAVIPSELRSVARRAPSAATRCLPAAGDSLLGGTSSSSLAWSLAALLGLLMVLLALWKSHSAPELLVLPWKSHAASGTFESPPLASLRHAFCPKHSLRKAEPAKVLPPCPGEGTSGMLWLRCLSQGRNLDGAPASSCSSDGLLVGAGVSGLLLPTLIQRGKLLACFSPVG
mmetsp:Transcript_128978/g.359118  ORF Transcript_128978/g.359118 Transcript_128978/m.359118 type:complete len:301 (-) Transcript_128978:413-1315(-)